MGDKYVFENEDSDDQKTTLAARDTWVGSILNSPFCVWVVLNLSAILYLVSL